MYSSMFHPYKSASMPALSGHSLSSGSDGTSNMLPVVLEQSGRGERAFDIYSRLLRERIVFLGSGVDDTLAEIGRAHV